MAGKKYSVICVAPDAKPEAEITLYKGESQFQLFNFNVIKTFRLTVLRRSLENIIFHYTVRISIGHGPNAQR